jgi:uncharacterized membrane protein
LLAWIISLYGIAKPNIFGIPFLPGFINQTSIEITLFIPTAILGGYLISEISSQTDHFFLHRWRKIWVGGVTAVWMGISIFGAQRLLPTLNPETFLFRETDRAAIEWVNENIPTDKPIIINPTEWGYGLFRGSDGGYWISPLTNHLTIPPNVLYGTNREQHLQVNEFIKNLQQTQNEDEIWTLIKQHDYEYIFIGTRGGFISTNMLRKSHHFESIYHYQNVWIFQRK